MKKLLIAAFLVATSLVSVAHALEFSCQTFDNQTIVANIGYNTDYVIKQFTVAGMDYTSKASFRPSRDGYSVVVKGFRKGEDLVTVMTGENSYYTIGKGRQQSMRCDPAIRQF